MPPLDTTGRKLEPSGDDVIKSFLNQFSQNQNHHQTLFIQFLSSVIVVLIGYAFVYSNTSGHVDQVYNAGHFSPYLRSNLTEDSSYILQPLQARSHESIKNKSGDILSYGLVHLVIIYLFSQMVLVILSLLILHMGYSFRRDQVAVNKIRLDSLSVENYEKYFFHFSGLNKRIYNYLPNFNSILFGGIFLIQLLLYVSIWIYLDKYPAEDIFISSERLNDITYLQTKYLLFIPALISFLSYVSYFIKYNKRINNLDHYKHMSVLRIENKKMLFLIGSCSLLLFMLSAILWIGTDSFGLMAISILNLANSIACFFSSILELKRSTIPKKYTTLYKMVVHGFIFLIGSASIVTLVFFPVSTIPAYEISQQSTFLVTFITVTLLSAISYGIKRKLFFREIEKEFKYIIRRQLGVGAYLIVFAGIGLLIKEYIQLSIFDRYFIPLSIAALGIIWGVRRIANAQDIAISRKTTEKST